MVENLSSEWSTLSASSVSDLTSSQGEVSGNRTRNLAEAPAGNEQNKNDHSFLYWRDGMTTIDVRSPTYFRVGFPHYLTFTHCTSPPMYSTIRRF
jgi:hypothetical protein